MYGQYFKQAGAELCQAQIQLKLELEFDRAFEGLVSYEKNSF